MDASLVNLNEEGEADYEEMMETAKKIHPNARVRMSADRVGTWEIYIPTTLEENRTLPDRFKGTAAWDAERMIDSSRCSALEWFAKEKNLTKFPIDCAGDYYNLNAEIAELFGRELQARGVSREELLDELGPQITGMRAILDMKWMED